MPEIAEKIADAIAGLHAEYYGHPPGSAHAIVHEDAVVVVLEETFTKAEVTMIGRGKVSEIQAIRREFQRAMAEDFHAVVEAATGRDVRTFMSDTDPVLGISIEVFLLAGDKTSMAGFEFPSEEPKPADPGD